MQLLLHLGEIQNVVTGYVADKSPEADLGLLQHPRWSAL